MSFRFLTYWIYLKNTILSISKLTVALILSLSLYFLETLSKVLIFIFIFVIALFISIIYLNDYIPYEIITRICSTIFIIYLVREIMKLTLRFYYWQEERQFKRHNKQFSSQTLYRWLEDVEVDQSFFYNLLGDKRTGYIVKDLKKVENKIKNVCSGNVNNMKLLKAYIEKQLSNNVFDRLMNSVVFTIPIIIITALVNYWVGTKDILPTLNGFITSTDTEIKTEHIITIIDYITYFIIFLIYCMYVWHIFTRKKNRLSFIVQIIDVAISETRHK
ncbi:hypothetical protein AQ616_17810 [Oceanobacillus sp. E9]|uniref:hypothetical protein n=1 Tax=Oceanobacillus sp. E9 TaxID=1742575 RepID=UPI00084EC9F8|nr:hypothetical protein [Oceanobacillus sp. E9]OEH53136.1 hypothetical protein AQ616_17810 [Oceanobacillus sp. E9]